MNELHKLLEALIFSSEQPITAAEKKPVLFMAYQSTCGHCEKMLNEVFVDTALANFYNKTYICIKEDLLQPEKAKSYLKRFYITSFPTFFTMPAS